MVGVSVAWHLQRRGFRVTMVDRKAPGEETSWGNAGIIQRECLQPYRIPTGFLNRIQILLNAKVDVRYDLASIPQNIYAIYLYWRNSSPRLYHKNSAAFASLIEHCTTEHERMIKASHSEGLVRKVGFLELFRTEPLSVAAASVEEQRAMGINVDLVTPDDLQKQEPSLNAKAFSCGFYFKDA